MTQLKSSYIDTPLGNMLAISDASGLYLLEFTDWRGLERKIYQLKTKRKTDILPGTYSPIDSIKHELDSYFSGDLREFKTPLHYWGSAFQNLVWKELNRLPYGETRSYLAQAKAVEKPKAFRAVANANATNPMAIIIPCHRIINNNGNLGGYGGGIARKKWLLDFEAGK